MVAAVATEEPQREPKPPQAPKHAIPKPPRRCPNQSLATSKSSCDRPVRKAREPMSTNIGNGENP